MEGSFDQWWKDNLDPAKLTATIKEMKVSPLCGNFDGGVF